jgi:hypothetical protein
VATDGAWHGPWAEAIQEERRSPMKYFMDTHDRTKGSFPDLRHGKTFCFMSGPDEEAIRKAHAAIDFPFDSITEVRRVTGADMRPARVAHVARS